MRYCLALFFVMLVTQVHAQDTAQSLSAYPDAVETQAASHTTVPPDEVVRKAGSDREAVTPRRFDNRKWKDITAGRDYSSRSKAKKQRRKSSDPSGQSGTDGENGDESDNKANARRKSEWVNDDTDERDQMSDPDNTVSYSGPINSLVLNIVMYGVIIIVVVAILYIIVKNVSFKGRGGKVNRDEKNDHAAPVEDIRELEIDRALREAMEAGNYRLAIRIYFLGLLKRLDEDGIIVWKKDKTNREYLSELFTKSYHFDEIQNLTHAYEHVWFSDHTFSAAAYLEIIEAFKAVNQKLKIPVAR